MEKLNFSPKGVNESIEAVDKRKNEKIIEKKYLSKEEKADLDKLLFNNKMNRIAELKNFVSSALNNSSVDGTTAVYFEEPNGFRVQLFKGFVQSSMNNKNFLPSDRSLNLDDYKKIADILKQHTDINVDTVNEMGVFGTVPMFSEDTYVSSHLGINPEDSEIKREKVLNYMNGQYSQEEDKAKITKIKESIYSFFKKDK